jgi:hypothetical protein
MHSTTSDVSHVNCLRSAFHEGPKPPLNDAKTDNSPRPAAVKVGARSAPGEGGAWPGDASRACAALIRLRRLLAAAGEGKDADHPRQSTGYPNATRVAMFVTLLFFAAPAAFWPGTACAAPAGADPAKPAKLFATDAALALTLTAPWQEFMRNKSAKKRYPGTLEYVDGSGAKHAVPVAFQARGHNRLKVCKFPGIKLIFEKQAMEGTPFRGNKSLKLSTHCDNGERWEQYAVKEMLAYHIYNLVTERSFKVRATSVTYVETGDHSSDGPHFGFLIEDDGDLAKRNHLEKLEVASIGLEQLEPLEASRFALFEYLIGNTDFAVLNGPTADRCCHNSVLIGANAPAKVFAVPYDFDSSGLVDASYAVPNAVLKIRSNRERVYRGFCTSNATLETARREFLRLEPQIQELGRKETRLVPGSREWVGDYLSKGFDALRDDGKFARDITEKCRK